MINHILAASLLLFTCTINGQTDANDASVSHLNLSAVSLPEAEMEGTVTERFTKVMRLAKLSGGIASLDVACSSGSRSIVSIDAGAPLGRTLDGIAGDAQSRWQINDDVVNVLPAGSIPPVLQMHIHRFEWNRAGSIRTAVGQLTGLSEVIKGAHELGLKPEVIQHWSSAICIRNCPKEPDPIMEVEEDVSLLTILNRIVRSHQGATWIYSQIHCGNETSYTISSQE